MSEKKVLKEDFFVDGAWTPTFRAGDTVEAVHVEQFGLQDLVVGEDTKEARELIERRQGRSTEKPRTSRPKRTNKRAEENVDPAPDHPRGEANDPDGQ